MYDPVSRGLRFPLLDQGYRGRYYETVDEHSVSIAYEGWICRYTTDGRILDLQRMAANRNGHYRVFASVAEKRLSVQIEILKA